MGINAQRRATRRILQINDEHRTTYSEPGAVIHEFVSFYQALLGGERWRSGGYEGNLGVLYQGKTAEANNTTLLALIPKLFASWSGLRLNVYESHLIISRFAQKIREQLLEMLGFQEGHLPMRYLGLPLLSSILSLTDCQPLLLKIEQRIKGWEGMRLSYAGRVHIIKSVLMALSIYWVSAFTLPKGVIREIEKRLRAFLWKGAGTSGYAKGLRDITTLNRALMSKKLCDVIRCDRTSIWVEWLYNGQLRDKSEWTVTNNGGSWGWRKLLHVHPLLRSMVDYQIGDGNSFYLWHDPWNHLGPLIERFPKSPRLLGLRTAGKLNSIITEGQWHWPLIIDMECLEILYALPIIHGEIDRIIWQFETRRPTIASLYKLLDPPGPKVGWSSLLSGSLKIPRHNFILWLAILGKLSTADKPWLSYLGAYILCDEGAMETHNYLFFRCRYARRCLTMIRWIVQFEWPNREWSRDVEWAARKWRGKHIINLAYRALLAACIYHIWRE
ncbi:UNVERIFIED_CONTAM: hypothetical protein Sindi_2691900 [Sesamum indicum]